MIPEAPSDQRGALQAATENLKTAQTITQAAYGIGGSVAVTVGSTPGGVWVGPNGGGVDVGKITGTVAVAVVETPGSVAVGCTGGRVGCRVGGSSVGDSSAGVRVGAIVGMMITTGKVGVGNGKGARVGCTGRRGGVAATVAVVVACPGRTTITPTGGSHNSMPG